MAPALADSAIWIDHFNDRLTPEVGLLRDAAGTGTIIVGDLVMMEILRGVRNEYQYRRIQLALLAFQQRDLASREILLKAGDNYRFLRALGFTVRSVVDCIIATYCIEHRLPLLHSDRDFDPFEQHLGLRVVR